MPGGLRRTRGPSTSRSRRLTWLHASDACPSGRRAMVALSRGNAPPTSCLSPWSSAFSLQHGRDFLSPVALECVEYARGVRRPRRKQRAACVRERRIQHLVSTCVCIKLERRIAIGVSAT
eukprot:scaffold15824_cov123-Isochrysis_galbana.AAC.2